MKSRKRFLDRILEDLQDLLRMQMGWSSSKASLVFFLTNVLIKKRLVDGVVGQTFRRRTMNSGVIALGVCFLG
jgi:hypothetical protein